MDKLEKVITGLKCCVDNECSIMENREKCPYFPKDGDRRLCIDNLLFDALELLKAQEAVEPVFERQFLSSIEIYDCGKCGTSVGAKGIAKYCMNCGQAVKWQ